MAAQLGEIIGAEVFFLEPDIKSVIGRSHGELPPFPKELTFDGRAF